MANVGKRVDAFPAFHFEVDIGGQPYPFRSVSGLKSDTKIYEVEEGGVNSHVHKLVGATTFPNLCLRQGFCDPGSPLYKLYFDFLNGDTKKRFDGFIRQIGPNGTSAKWIFKHGWICKWEGPELDATKNEVSIEAIDIAHEGLYLIGSGTPPATAKKGGILSSLKSKITGTPATGSAAKGTGTATPSPSTPTPSAPTPSTAPTPVLTPSDGGLGPLDGTGKTYDV